MIPVRAAPLRPEIEYFLDSAQEVAELDACSAMTLRLYGTDAVIAPIISGDLRHYKKRRPQCLRLAEVADEILADLPVRRRAGLVGLGLKFMATEIVSLAEVLSAWAIDDEVDGGAMKPFRLRVRSKNGVPFKRTSRRLMSPKFIRRSAKSNIDSAVHLRALTAVLVARARALPPGVEWRDPGISAEWQRQVAAAARRYYGDPPLLKHSDRKVILRSLKTATAVLGEESVRAFVRGEEIRLIGRDTILAIRKRRLLSDRGDGCLSVGMMDRNGASLANLCTFIENTPTLDQLTGFALLMRAGEERDILDKANLISTTAAGDDHPLIQQRRRARQENMAAAMANLQGIDPEMAYRIVVVMGARPRRRFIRQLSYEDWRARNDAYWRATQGLWTEALVCIVIGYRDLPVFKAAGAL